MPTIEVAVVRRETARAVQLVFWDERLGHHVSRWAPKSMVLTECHAGDRDITVELSSRIVELGPSFAWDGIMQPGWEFLREDEWDEYRAWLKQLKE